MSVDYPKLKTNLNLIMHRLKLVEKKKMELNQKARRTIGEFLMAGKVDRARIRVEQIIREDYVVEAMDLVESYCDFILSRFGQLQNTKVVDEGLATAVSSLIWITPRFDSDVPELRVISDQLSRKYGKPYVQAVLENQMKTVNETLMKKMSMEVPPKVLVEKYLVEIAKDQKIDYKPDSKVMKEQQIFQSSGFRPSSPGDEGGSSQRQDEPPQSGFNLIDLGDHYPRSPITQPFNAYGQLPPPLPSEPPLGLSDTPSDIVDASAPISSIPIGFNLDSLDELSVSSTSSKPQLSAQKFSDKTDSIAATGSNAPSASNSGKDMANSEGPPPNYESVVNKLANKTQYYSFGPDSISGQEDHNDTLPELPPVPQEPKEQGHTDERLDFEDLTRRFEELKNKN